MPRQARDKHRESAQKQSVFKGVPAYVENVFELLGSATAGHPGEFYVDSAAALVRAIGLPSEFFLECYYYMRLHRLVNHGENRSKIGLNALRMDLCLWN